MAKAKPKNHYENLIFITRPLERTQPFIEAGFMSHVTTFEESMAAAKVRILPKPVKKREDYGYESYCS